MGQHVALILPPDLSFFLRPFPFILGPFTSNLQPFPFILSPFSFRTFYAVRHALCAMRLLSLATVLPITPQPLLLNRTTSFLTHYVFHCSKIKDKRAVAQSPNQKYLKGLASIKTKRQHLIDFWSHQTLKI